MLNLPRSDNKSFSITNKLIVLILSLLVFGVVIIYDSTFVSSQQIYGKNWYFALLQFIWAVIGLIGFGFFYFIDYKKLKKFSFYIFVFSLFTLLLLALVGIFPCESSPSFAPCVNGANRWLYLPFNLPLLNSVGFQPAELVKLALILYLSIQLSIKKNEDDAFILYIVISMLVSGLILLQPNMSTAVMVFAISTSIYLSLGYSLKKLITLAPILLVFALILILSTPYRRERLLTFTSNKNDFTQERNLKEDYHVKQISISLGSGGLWGVGLGQSRQKYQYLPEVATDSIFAIIGEELGFFGTTFLLFLYAYLIYLGFFISIHTKDLSARLISTGISFWISAQVLVNISAMTSLIPLTGVPLPLISYGGSSMIFTLSALGILANISKDI